MNTIFTLITANLIIGENQEQILQFIVAGTLGNINYANCGDFYSNCVPRLQVSLLFVIV